MNAAMILLVAAFAAPILVVVCGAFSAGLVPFVAIVTTAIAAAIAAWSFWQPDAIVDVSWAATWGFRFELHLDGLARLYALLATGIGFFVVAYASRYIALHLEHQKRPLVDQTKFFFFLLLFMATAFAQQQVTIDTGDDPDSRLELRNYVLPDGTEVSFYVMRGDPLTIGIGEQQLTAQHVEVDLTRNELRVIGFGTFFNGSETVEGEDLIISLGEESFSARDVLVITGELDVLGSEAWRVPGQISFLDGSFSPCSRCGQEVEDYGFKADRLELYPGDRLIAYGVTMLIRGREFLHLPLMVVPLSRKDRQPQLVIEQGTDTERARVSLDWPYVTGPHSYGLFSIRYYADVDTSGGGLTGRILGGSVDTHYLGGGFNHWFYTETGTGTFRVMYRPPFLNEAADGGRDPAHFDFRWHWQTDPALTEAGEPQGEVLVERDDGRRYGIVEYRTSLVRVDDLLRTELFSQGFFDLHRFDDELDPSWWSRRTPRRSRCAQSPWTRSRPRFSTPAPPTTARARCAWK